MHNLELFKSNDPMQAGSKSYKVHDPALAALTAKPEMVFESGRVKIKAPIAAKAHLGAYTIEVQAVTPIQMTVALKPPTIMNKYPRVRGKFKVWLEFYQKIDPIFTEEYFLGEGENGTKRAQP